MSLLLFILCESGRRSAQIHGNYVHPSILFESFCGRGFGPADYNAKSKKQSCCTVVQQDVSFVSVFYSSANSTEVCLPGLRAY